MLGDRCSAGGRDPWGLGGWPSREFLNGSFVGVFGFGSGASRVGLRGASLQLRSSGWSDGEPVSMSSASSMSSTVISMADELDAEDEEGDDDEDDNEDKRDEEQQETASSFDRFFVLFFVGVIVDTFFVWSCICNSWFSRLAL